MTLKIQVVASDRHYNVPIIFYLINKHDMNLSTVPIVSPLLTHLKYLNCWIDYVIVCCLCNISLEADVMFKIYFPWQVLVNRHNINVKNLWSQLRVIDKDVPRTDRDQDYFK
jgi:hypothetical protein